MDDELAFDTVKGLTGKRLRDMSSEEKHRLIHKKKFLISLRTRFPDQDPRVYDDFLLDYDTLPWYHIEKKNIEALVIAMIIYRNQSLDSNNWMAELNHIETTIYERKEALAYYFYLKTRDTVSSDRGIPLPDDILDLTDNWSKEDT